MILLEMNLKNFTIQSRYLIKVLLFMLLDKRKGTALQGHPPFIPLPIGTVAEMLLQ